MGDNLHIRTAASMKSVVGILRARPVVCSLLFIAVVLLMLVSRWLKTLDSFFGRPVQRALKMINGRSSHYLGYAGAPLPPPQVLYRSHRELASTCLGNPHSQSSPANAAARLTDSVRLELLHLFGASPKEYTLVFTANATDALRRIAHDLVQMTMVSNFIYTRSSHTSVLGLRENALQNGARAYCIEPR